MEVESEDADIFSGCGNGTLDVSISHDLDISGRTWDESKGDRHLHICINDDDLVSIASEMFHFVVGQPPKIEPYVHKNWGRQSGTNNFGISYAKPNRRNVCRRSLQR